MNFIELSRGEKKLSVRFRPMTEKDAPFMVECIRDEYGETYFKQSFYDQNELIRENARGHIRFFAAESKEGEIVGMLALKRFLPREEMCEIASEIFLKKYRGFGMAYPFFQYAEENINLINEKEPISAIYCLPVLFHDMTQRLMERLGLVPTGFVFGKFRLSAINHSYGSVDTPKHPQGIMIKKLAKQSAGKIFVPVEHRALTEKIYRALGADFSFGEEGGEILAESEIFCENDEIQRNTLIYVDKAGEDLAARVKALREKYSGEDATFSVFLNISEAGATKAYETLRGLGCIFAGFQPLCSPREYMVLHNPMGVPLGLDTLRLTPFFAHLKDYVAAHL